jgi:hypothetical protein
LLPIWTNKLSTKRNHMEFPTLARGARLISLGLKDESGQDIGKVVEWVLDVDQGKILYIIAEFSNSPGYYPIPWKKLSPAADRSGYIVNPEDVMRTELFMNTHDLFEIAEDPYFYEKIENAYRTPNRVPQRTPYAPEHVQSQSQRVHTFSPSREYIPLDAMPQLQNG